MDVVRLELEVNAYRRLRELVLAGGKWQATGEAGMHSASQLLLLMDEQVAAAARQAEQQAQAPPENKPAGAGTEG